MVVSQYVCRILTGLDNGMPGLIVLRFDGFDKYVIAMASLCCAM